MRLNTETLDDECVNKIISVSGGMGVIGGAASIGVVANFEPAVGSNDGPIPPHLASIEVTTSGECNVKTACVAGDWFSSDTDGLAVKTESGFALGRILADPVDGLALCVVSPAFL